jgi:hypothetical protein
LIGCAENLSRKRNRFGGKQFEWSLVVAPNDRLQPTSLRSWGMRAAWQKRRDNMFVALPATLGG